jgi:hypothetical protein
MIALSLLNVIFLAAGLVISSAVSLFICNLLQLGKGQEWEDKKGGGK